MSDNLRERSSLSEEEKERIAREMIQGYRKMAKLNKELAEEGLGNRDGETEK